MANVEINDLTAKTGGVDLTDELELQETSAGDPYKWTASALKTVTRQYDTTRRHYNYGSNTLGNRPNLGQDAVFLGNYLLPNGNYGNYSVNVGYGHHLDNSASGDISDSQTVIGYKALSKVPAGTIDQNIIIGYESGTGVTTTTEYSIHIGNRVNGDDLPGSGGDYNVLIGYYAGGNVDSGNYQINIGAYAGEQNGGQAYSQRIGSQAGRYYTNTSSAYESLVGYAVVGKNNSNQNHIYNVVWGALGWQGTANSDYCVSVGYDIADVQTGAGSDRNTAIGAFCCDNGWISADNFVSMGFQAQSAINYVQANQGCVVGASGVRNGYGSGPAIGYRTRYTAFSLSAVGVSIGHRAASFEQNGTTVHFGYDTGFGRGGNGDSVANTCFFGAYAGYYHGTGVRNTGFGSESLYSTSGTKLNGLDNTAFGYRSGYGMLGGSYNTLWGTSAGVAVSTGQYNVCIGDGSAPTLTTGSDNVVIGTDADVSAAGAACQIVIGDGAVGGADNRVNIGNATNTIYADFNSAATWTYTSDERLKNIVSDSPLGLEFIDQIDVKEYRWKPLAEWPVELRGEAKDDPDTESLLTGVAAQNIKEALDGIEFQGWKELPSGKQTVAPGALVFPLINAIKELTAEIEKLEAAKGAI